MALAVVRELQALVGQAVRAPSSHNTQPWRFRMRETSVDLLADRTRALPVNDPHDRELTISCGAALMNLRVAAAHAGLGVRVRPFPSADDADWLAGVEVVAGAAPRAGESALFDSIARRVTCRKPFSSRPVESDVVGRLVEAAVAEHGRLLPIESEIDRHLISGLVAEGDARQWANPDWRRELAAWMHPRRRGDGLATPGAAVPVAQLVVRTFDLGGRIGTKDRDLAEGSPLLAVVATTGDAARDWLVAGQALERVLLTACGLGLQASYLNQPIQEAALRSRLQKIVGGASFPQVLLRLGYPAAQVPPAPRRNVAAVLE